MTTAKPLSWLIIIGILLLTAVGTGMVLGLLHDTLGINPGAGVGAAVGIVGALLIINRRKALAAHNGQK